MKLLKVIIILSSFFFISNCNLGDYSIKKNFNLTENIPAPSYLNTNERNDPGKYLWRNTQYLDFSLNNDDKKLHQSAIYHTLNNLDNNQITRWYSKDNTTFGIVRVIDSFEVSNGYCRIYQTVIEVDNIFKNWTNKACKRGNSEWIFLK